MKAAIIREAGRRPVYSEFEEPCVGADEVLIDVSAAPLSHVTRARASGAHYSGAAGVPFVVGLDGTGRRPDGRRVYFFMPRAPFGSMASRTVVSASRCVPLPDDVDDVAAAAMAVPAMSSWAALKERARFVAGETVLVNGATGTSGRLAVQIARHLGAKKIIATGRSPIALDALGRLGANATISLALDERELANALEQQFRGGVDVVLDYLWGHSAERLLAAATKIGNPLRFVQIGSIGGPTIPLSAQVLRSFPLELVGSGIGSLPLPRILNAIDEVLRAAAVSGFAVATKAVPLADLEQYWSMSDTLTRTVFRCQEARSQDT
jgi:NADPH:quinone reductase-like Zn-dependent oxidoreductase